MSVLPAALASAALGFAAGWYGHDKWTESRTQKRVAEVAQTTKRRFSSFGIAYFAMVAVIIGSIIYGNVTTRSQISASESRQINENRRAIACLSDTFQEFLSGNQELRDASARRDEAFLKWVVALKDLIYLRVIVGIDDNPAVQDAAALFMDEAKKFIEASEDLVEARSVYKLPDFEAKCGRIIKVPTLR